jgi:hypothetical protein
MKRKMFLLALVGLLLVVLSASTVVVADRGDAPHDGECVAYCARAGVFFFNPDTEEWERQDMDGDGKTESCLIELNCHKNEDTNCGMLVHPPDNNPCWPTCKVVHGPGRPWHGH